MDIYIVAQPYAGFKMAKRLFAPVYVQGDPMKFKPYRRGRWEILIPIKRILLHAELTPLLSTA
jgi:hypothetical protein